MSSNCAVCSFNVDTGSEECTKCSSGYYYDTDSSSCVENLCEAG